MLRFPLLFAVLVGLSICNLSTAAQTQTPNYNGLISAANSFLRTSDSLNGGTIKCVCKASLQFLANRIIEMANALKVFEKNPAAKTPQIVPSALWKVQNSAHHLITDVWQSDGVKAALSDIIEASKQMQTTVAGARSPSPLRFQIDLWAAVDRYIKDTVELDDAVKGYIDKKKK